MKVALVLLFIALINCAPVGNIVKAAGGDTGNAEQLIAENQQLSKSLKESVTNPYYFHFLLQF